MKRIGYLAVFAFVTLGVLLWASQSFVTLWEPMLRNELEHRASDALQKRVQVDHLSLSYLHRLDIHGVEVWERTGHPISPIFRAKRISLTISLLDVPHALLHRRPEEIIGLISLDSPVATLGKDDLLPIHSSARGRPHPLFFAISWEHGTFQWKDERAPHGTWSLYNSNGIFRLRGPKMDGIAEGGLEQAKSVQVRFSSWGRTWTGSVRLQDADVAETLAVTEHFLDRPLLPASWKSQGTFSLEAKGGGRMPFKAEPLSKMLQEASVSLKGVQVEPELGAPPVELIGSAEYKDARITLSNVSARSGKDSLHLTGHLWPFGTTPRMDLQAAATHVDLSVLNHYALSDPTLLQGFADGSVSLEGPFSNPEMRIDVKASEGQFRNRPFQNADVHALYTNHHWEIRDTSIQLWHGILAVKGYASKDQLALDLTAGDIALKEATAGALDGKANFACSIKGPPENPRWLGSFWATGFTWGGADVESFRGNFDLTDHHLHGEAASDDGEFRLAAEATQTANALSIEQLEIQLRSGAHLSVHGTLAHLTQKLRLAFQMQDLDLANDIPHLQERVPDLQGQVSLTGRVDGTLAQPSVKATLTGQDLHFSSATLHSVQADLHWTPEALEVSAFHLHPGLDGSFQADLKRQEWSLTAKADQFPIALVSAWIMPHSEAAGNLSGDVTLKKDPVFEGHGTLELHDAHFGSFPVSESHLRFTLSAKQLQVDEAELTSTQFRTQMNGHAYWEVPTEAALPALVRFTAQGKVQSISGAKKTWDAPLQIHGSLHPREKWNGEVLVKARTVHLREQDTEPFQVHLSWIPQQLSWDAAKWGENWTSNGTLHFPGNHTVPLTGELDAHQAPLGRYQQWFAPQIKEPVEGFLTGHFGLSGTLGDPIIDFAGGLQNGHWRDFHFDSDLRTQWKKGSFDPVHLTGKFARGGSFHFEGHVLTGDGTAAGTLEVVQLNLAPIGQSLFFPHPLQGTANGTFTVSGPINALHLTGHLEGNSIAYGEPAAAPIRLSSVVGDLTMEPNPDQPGVTRLTLSQADAKTQEEEIRVAPGSYIEFAGHRAARLQVATEIRNLHLGLFTLFGGLDLSGSWEIKPQGFSISGDAHTRSLFINDYELEEGQIQASYYDGILTFTRPSSGVTLVTGSLDLKQVPQLKFTNFYITGRQHQGLKLNGDVGPDLWDFALQGQGLDIGTLSGLAGFPYPLEGTADVVIQGRGDLKHPHVTGDITVADGRVMGLSFQSGAAAFAWEGNRMTFTHLVLTDPGRYTLTGAGVFPVASTKANVGDTNHDIDFSVRLINSNLGLLQSITPEVKQAKGSVDALLQIKGTSDAPSLRGSIKIQHGDVVGAHYFRHLRDFHMVADLDGNDLVLSDFGGRSGDGEFQGSGHILYSGFEPRLYDLHLNIPSAKGIEVTVPELAIPSSPLARNFHFLTSASQAVVKGHVAFQGPAEDPTFSGAVSLTNGHFTFPPQSKNPPPPAFMAFARRINWDMDLKFSEGAWFENELVEANLNGGLHFKGPSDKLRVDGGMDIPEGKISYLGVQFDIQQARFDIRTQDVNNDWTTTPYVRGVADSTVQTIDPVTGQGVDDTITLTIDYAPINEIKPRLVSALDPSLTQDKLFARVTQLELTNLTPQEQTYLYQQQAVRLLDTSLTTPLANSLLKRTGLVDQVRVSRVINPANATPLDPNAAAAQQSQSQTALNLLAGTKYTLAKNLSNKLSLGYGLRFEQITQPDTFQNKLDLRSDVEMSYRMLSNVYLKGSFDLPTTTPGAQPDRRVTIEPRWRFGWWGNTNKPKPKPVVPVPEPAN